MREPAAALAAPPAPARRGAVWDRRFRLVGPAFGEGEAGGLRVGALGAAEAARLRRLAPRLPAAVLATLPALRGDGALAAVPALLYPDPAAAVRFAMVFAPAAGSVDGT